MSAWISEYKKTIIKTSIIATIVLVAICLLLGCISGAISSFLNKFWQIIAPITIGFSIAYLSNPFVSFFDKRIFKWITKFKIRRLVSILITFAFIIAFIVFVITLLIPNLVSTAKDFWETYIVNYEDSIKGLANSINSLMDDFKINPDKRIDPDSFFLWTQNQFPWIEDLASGDFSAILSTGGALAGPNIEAILGLALAFGSSLFNAVKNVVLGLFIAGYMLMAKERVKAYIRRFLNSFLKPKKVRAIVRFGKLMDRTFGGFIEGQLIDAGIVGIICFIIFSIFGIPIPHLLATIIAVTNVIPIFGPFIGGIPAAFLVLLTNPGKLILFIVLIFVIQQIDGNIICPHILGDRINISSLATIIAIVTMGGLFGIFGMVIGVPVFAVAIHIINTYTMNSLRKKGLETSLNHYYVGNLEKITDKKSPKKLTRHLIKKSKNKNDEEK